MPERFPIAASRQRWLEFVELEHATLATVRDFGREGDELLVWREAVAGRRIAEGRVPRALAAQLFLQAAAAAAFFASRGFVLDAGDFDEARWEICAGTARLWLARTPRTVAGPALPVGPSAALAALLARLYERGGRITAPAVRTLLDQLHRHDAAARRAEFWVAGAFRTFPELGLPAASGARQRCLGLSERALRTARARTLCEKARALLAGSIPRIFEVEGSAVAPGSALGLVPSPRGAAEASRRLREAAESIAPGGRPVWIAVAPEQWDELSRRGFDAARLALAERVDVVTVPARLPAPVGPDEWRRALWVPTGAIAGSVRFCEWFVRSVAAAPHGAIARAREALASPGFAAFVADATGEAPLPERTGVAAAPGVESACLSDRADDPGARIEELLATGRRRAALEEARRWIASTPGCRPEHGSRSPRGWPRTAAKICRRGSPRWRPSVKSRAAGRWRRRRGWSASPGPPRPTRKRDGGRGCAWPRSPCCSERPPGSRAAPRHGGRSTGMRRSRSWRGRCVWRRSGWRGMAGAAAPSNGSTRRTAPAHRASPSGSRRRWSGRRCSRWPEASRPKTRCMPRSGRKSSAPATTGSRRGFWPRRRAACSIAASTRAPVVRLEEAIGSARDDPAERAALAIDFAATLYHAGQAERSEEALGDAVAAAAAAGREDLARIARSNRAARNLGLSRQALLYLIRELRVPDRRKGSGA